jgi:hypothetical protein
MPQVADPECRAVAARAAKELMRVANEGKTVPPKKADPATVTAALKELIAARNPSVAGDAVFAPTLSYVAGLVASLQVSSSGLCCTLCAAAAGQRLSYVESICLFHRLGGDSTGASHMNSWCASLCSILCVATKCRARSNQVMHAATK